MTCICMHSQSNASIKNSLHTDMFWFFLMFQSECFYVLAWRLNPSRVFEAPFQFKLIFCSWPETEAFRNDNADTDVRRFVTLQSRDLTTSGERSTNNELLFMLAAVVLNSCIL